MFYEASNGILLGYPILTPKSLASRRVAATEEVKTFCWRHVFIVSPVAPVFILFEHCLNISQAPLSVPCLLFTVTFHQVSLLVFFWQGTAQFADKSMGFPLEMVQNSRDLLYVEHCLTS